MMIVCINMCKQPIQHSLVQQKGNGPYNIYPVTTPTNNAPQICSDGHNIET